MTEVANYNDKSNKRPICRDYIKGSCSRGENCRYKHPHKAIAFCHDFINGCCNRIVCAFIHCTKEQLIAYRNTGILPSKDTVNEQPLCKDFLKGVCDRAHCKFRHLAEAYSPPEPPQKRRRFDDLTFSNEQHHNPPPLLWTLEDENALLRKSVADLRKRVDDLQATNEFLLEQNAQMRLNDKRGLTAVTVPAAVTITNGQIQPQVSGIRTVTASVATVPVSIAAVAGTPVSIATVSCMSTVMPAPSVSVATTHDHSVEPTTQLVSYPIVAHPSIVAPTSINFKNDKLY